MKTFFVLWIPLCFSVFANLNCPAFFNLGRHVDENRDLVDCTLLENCYDESCINGKKVRINEVQYHPVTINDSIAEYVELYNYGDKCVHLSSWRLVESNGWDMYFSYTNIIPAKGYFVIAGEYYQPLVCNFEVDDILGKNMGLNNDADSLTLYSDNGFLISKMKYEDQCLGGVSLSFYEHGGWKCSEDAYYGEDDCPNHGSPGRKN